MPKGNEVTKEPSPTLRERVAGAGEEVDPRSRIQITGLRKDFRRVDGETVTAIDGVDLSVRPSELVVLLGPSGCGKTTLLRCVAGLETPDGGTITLGSRTVYSDAGSIMVPPEHRDAGMMFQSYALWPHMTVADIVGYPLRVRRVDRAQARQRVDDLLAMMNIQHLTNENPGRLSGGQQQRVALARSLATSPDVVLFDEPLSNVDAKVRKKLRIELLAMKEEFGFSGIYVTHDQEEAMHIGDRIAVLRDGRIEQIGSPAELYHSPASLYVAGFLGELNEVPGVTTQVDGQRVAVETSIGTVWARNDHGLGVGAEAIAVFRPEDANIAAPGGPDAVNAWDADCLSRSFLGTHTELLVRVAGAPTPFTLPLSREYQVPTDNRVRIHVAPDAVQVLAV